MDGNATKAKKWHPQASSLDVKGLNKYRYLYLQSKYNKRWIKSQYYRV